jgi:hypothetical protein
MMWKTLGGICRRTVLNFCCCLVSLGFKCDGEGLRTVLNPSDLSVSEIYVFGGDLYHHILAWASAVAFWKTYCGM